MVINDKEKLNQLYQYALALTGDEQLAYDLVQDSIEKLIPRAFVINKVAYAKKVIRNKFFDITKSKTVTTSVSLVEEDHFSENKLDQDFDNKLAIEELLKKLKADERELLYLWAVEENTTSEISMLTGVPKGTITSKLKRLRDRLQNELGENRG